MSEMDSLAQINALLNQPNTFSRNLAQIVQLAHNFTLLYESKESSLAEIDTADDLRPILATVGDPAAVIPVDVDTLIATILKVLLRKPVNRLALGKYGMTAIIRSLNRIQTEKNIPAAAEMCNVVLNTCYDGANVQLLIELDGMTPLLRFLKSREVPVLCSSLGALQGLCYVPRGRQCLRQNLKVCSHLYICLVEDSRLILAIVCFHCIRYYSRSPPFWRTKTSPYAPVQWASYTTSASTRSLLRLL
jgi:hypothetical protein